MLRLSRGSYGICADPIFRSHYGCYCRRRDCLSAARLAVARMTTLSLLRSGMKSVKAVLSNLHMGAQVCDVHPRDYPYHPTFRGTGQSSAHRFDENYRGGVCASEDLLRINPLFSCTHKLLLIRAMRNDFSYQRVTCSDSVMAPPQSQLMKP